MPNKNTENFFYTEVYTTSRLPRSTEKDDRKGKIMFSLDIHKTIEFYDGEVERMFVSVKPTILDTPPWLSQLCGLTHETWELCLSRRGEEKPFHSSLFLNPKLYGLGIGSIMMNVLIKEGKAILGSSPAKLTIMKEKTDRMASIKYDFYEQFGFDMHKVREDGHGTISIDHFYNLTGLDLDNKKHIEQVDISRHISLSHEKIAELRSEKEGIADGREHHKKYAEKYAKKIGNMVKQVLLPMGVVMIALAALLIACVNDKM